MRERQPRFGRRARRLLLGIVLFLGGLQFLHWLLAPTDSPKLVELVQSGNWYGSYGTGAGMASKSNTSSVGEFRNPVVNAAVNFERCPLIWSTPLILSICPHSCSILTPSDRPVAPISALQTASTKDNTYLRMEPQSEISQGPRRVPP